MLESVLDMLAGRYPSDEFAELRARITWDRLSDTLTGRRGAQRLAVTSGGTIPDRGLYAVFLATGEGPGRRVGELDEEMVYESRVGDLFTLGTSTWRIEDITHDRVLVTPAPGLPGRLPFWKGDSLGRPAELGRAVGAFVREVEALTPGAARERVMAAGLDDWAADNLLGYLREQREATGHVPDDRAIVVERFRDELGDWRVAILSPFGAQVHAPWALAVSARMRDRFGVDVQAMHGDDGIVLRLPDIELDDLEGVRERGVGRELLDLVTLDPDDVRGLVTEEIGGSALFAARFRECAARALLLPRRRPDRRQPLWQQRQRASQLLEVASQYPTFPIVLEAVRECVQDVFDVPGLVDLMRDIGSRRVTVVDVESSTPSPFAKSLLFGYVAQFLYEGDSPLAERRAAALALDPSLLAELLGTSEGLALRDLLDAEQIARTEAELQRLTPERAARDADDVLDLLRSLGPLPVDGILARCREGTTGDDVEAWLAGLARRPPGHRGARRRRGPLGGHRRRLPAARRARRLAAPGRAAGLPRAGGRPARRPRRPLRPHPRAVPRRRGGARLRAGPGRGDRRPGPAGRRPGRVVEGELLPTGGGGTEFCDAEVLRLLRRRSLAALRAEVEPVTPVELARFLQGWQGVGGRLRGRDGLVRVVEQLSGAVLPASALESLVLPARVADYSPGPARRADGHRRGALVRPRVAARRRRLGLAAPRRLRPPHPARPRPRPRALGRRARGARRPGRRWRALLPHPVRPGGLHRRPRPSPPRCGTSSGRAGSPATPSPRCARCSSGGRTAHRRTASGPRRTRYAGRRGPLGGLGAAPARPALPARTGPPQVTGRWSLLPPVDLDPTLRAYATAELLLDRHGILTRGATAAEDVPGGFAAIYRVLGRAEEAGRVRRGYFVEGLGASQFGTTGAVDRLRSGTGGVRPRAARPRPQAHRPPSCSPRATRPTRTARRCPGPTARSTRSPTARRRRRATDKRRRHQPGRKAGAVVVLVDGELVLYVERGGKTLLTYSDDPDLLRAAATALADAVRAAAWAGSPSRRPTADSCSARATPSSRPSRRPASTSRRAVCGCGGDDERPRRPPGEHGDRRAHRRPERALGQARRGEVERRTHGADPADPAQQHALPARCSGRTLGRDRHGHRTPHHGGATPEATRSCGGQRRPRGCRSTRSRPHGAPAASGDLERRDARRATGSLRRGRWHRRPRSARSISHRYVSSR